MPLEWVTPSQHTAVVPTVAPLQKLGSGVEPALQAVSEPGQSLIVRKDHCAPAGSDAALTSTTPSTSVSMERSFTASPSPCDCSER